jgi:hypothetical protein
MSTKVHHVPLDRQDLPRPQLMVSPLMAYNILLKNQVSLKLLRNRSIKNIQGYEDLLNE